MLAADEEFIQVVEDAFRLLLPVSERDSSWRIAGVDETAIAEPETGGTRTRVMIRLAGISRQRGLGQYPPFDASQLRGFYENYVFGFVHGWYAAKYGRSLWSDYELVIDVERGDDQAPEQDPMQRFVPLSQAVKGDGLVSDSPLHKAMERYKLKYVLYAGKWPSGPSTSMILAIEAASADHKPRRVLDLFAGTCSLAAVALRCGAERATCVDPHLDEQMALETLGELSPRCRLLRQDVEEPLPSDTFDLVLMDPYYDFALHAIRDVIPRIRGQFRWLLVNLGPREPRAWNRMLLAALAEQDLSVEMVDRQGEVTALCAAAG